MTRSLSWLNIRRIYLSNRCSPIADLPVEVLDIIFLHYAHDIEPYLHVQEATGSSFSSRAREIVNPMILGKVNQRWRRISRGLPPLWAKIYVSYPASKHVDLARLWLSLAAASPLTLVITASAEQDTVTMHRLLDLFLSYYDAWYIVDFRLSPQLHSLLLRVPNYPPPTLSSIHVEAVKLLPSLIREEPHPIDILHSSPTLRRVDWSSPCYSLPKALKKFSNWASLVELFCSQNSVDNGTLPTVTDCLTILFSCPVLESLDIMIYPSDGRPFPTDMQLPFCHSSLQTLRVATSAKLLYQLFESVVFPKLEGLTIQHMVLDFSGNPFLTDAHPILDLLERSSCKLRDFALYTPYAIENMLLDLISASQLHHVRSLCLTGTKTEQTINLLTRKSSDPQSLTILPRLEHLTFCNNPPFSTLHVTVDLLQRMILSRITPIYSEGDSSVALLRYANLDVWEIDFWEYHALRKLQRADFTIIPVEKDLVPTLQGWIMDSLCDKYFEMRNLFLQCTSYGRYQN